jgi:CheY-like chemotaxis protein
MIYTSALIVDDSKLARITLRKKLSSYGLSVALAESGKEALTAIEANKPDIIFLDHLMPEMDGFEAAQAIRKLPAFADTPIIMCTGKEHDGYLAEAQAIGANQILSKPPVDEALEKILNTQFDMSAAVPVVDLEQIAVSENSHLSELSEFADIPELEVPSPASDMASEDLLANLDLAEDIADFDGLADFDDIDISSISLDDDLLSADSGDTQTSDASETALASSVVQPVEDLGDLSDLGSNIFTGSRSTKAEPQPASEPEPTTAPAEIDQEQIAALVSASVQEQLDGSLADTKAQLEQQLQQLIHALNSDIAALKQQHAQKEQNAGALVPEPASIDVEALTAASQAVFQQEKVGLVADVIAAIPSDALAGKTAQPVELDSALMQNTVEAVVTEQLQSLRGEIANLSAQVDALTQQSQIATAGEASASEPALSLDDMKLLVQAEINTQIEQFQSITAATTGNAANDDKLKQLETLVAQQLAANKAATEGLINEALAEFSTPSEASQPGLAGDVAQQLEDLSEQQRAILSQQQLPKNLSSIAIVLGVCALALSAFLFIR